MDWFSFRKPKEVLKKRSFTLDAIVHVKLVFLLK